MALLCALSDGVLDAVPLDRVDAFRAALGPWLAEHCSAVLALDDASKSVSDELAGGSSAALLALAQSIAGPATNAAQVRP